MRISKHFSSAAVGLLLLNLAHLSAQDVVISELMASNLSTIQDQDGNYSDWLELYNAGAATVNLNGWYLTDDPLNLGKWSFPAVNLAPDGFLLVFASGEDRSDPTSELHTNFKLATEGGYLALVKPDGATRAWEYANYPAQIDDFSYGLEQSASSDVVLAPGAAAKALIPTSGALGTTWTSRTFNDSAWKSGATGWGYDRVTDYVPLIGLDLRAEMDNVNASAYLRVPFTIPAGVAYTSFQLRMKYDDGFVAYLNGTEIASRNAPATPSWSDGATSTHDDGDAVVFEDIDVPAAASAIVTGTNVLAIQGLNSGSGSSDFLIVPELDAFDSGALNRNVKQFFHNPTPGSGNLPGFPGISGTVAYSRPSGVFTGTTTVQLTKDTAGGVIRYTLDGTEPAESSTPYSSTLNISTSTYLRARVIEPGLAPGPIVNATFLLLAADVQNFNSNVPIILLENFGAGAVPGVDYQPVFMAVFEAGPTGRASLKDVPTLVTRAGIKTRGSSTGGQPKPNLALETWDERNADKDYPVLGLPSESDWILHAPYGFDPALMRNPLIYELSNQIGRYAVRTRFCEVYLNTGGGALAQVDYMGVYNFMEKIKRGSNRVDVKKMPGSYNSEPLISGGYIAKIDRLDPGDSGFSAGGQVLGHVYPKEDFVSAAQKTWISSYITSFVNALNGANFRDPVNGYAKYIDPLGWVDHHILNVLAKNVDALRLSTYMYKDREDRLVMGPIWDFDRSMDSTDGRDDAYNTWNGTGDATTFFTYPWWGRLFADVDFWQLWKDRWQELRRGPLATSNVSGVVDSMANEIRESQARNAAKWGGGTGGAWQTNVNSLKTWLSNRSNWIDGQFLSAPVLSSPGGPITPGFSLTISAPAGTIWYTTNGKDPRAPGGTPAPGALQYSGAITLDENSRVVARRTTAIDNWSGPAAATFVVDTPRLVVAEILYHPTAPAGGSGFGQEDFEFLELMNADDQPIVPAGFRVSGGIEFIFPSSDTAPLLVGDRLVIVKNLAAFASRYDTADLRIAGEFTRNLNNGPDRLVVEGPLREPILDFSYDSAWYEEANGAGSSLVIVDPQAALSTWGTKESWQPSAVFGGTPGEDESGVPLGGRQIPGDSNQDGSLDIADAVSLLLRLFAGGSAGLPCDGDSISTGANLLVFSVNGDAQVNVTDVVHLLNFLFKNGPGPALGSSCVRISGCTTACGS